MLDTNTIVRMSVAFLLGSIIGIERQKKGRFAGLRTHILVCMGSTLIMLVSVKIHDLHNGLVPVDPSRIAAGVVTGVGFLGAGTIMHSSSSDKIRGLTTAASIWMSSAIGLAVGIGFYDAAVIGTSMTYLCLSLLKKTEEKI
ncbi:MAG: MgtC/SapB family protein [Candidatus Omnitrophica bacterium]|nr:MgtC/SapB family protein [Candidatus Omnitrophota bacterium]MDD5081398.1 MgtC/SapB family protein [Candidatus Omnitrophota bacterium]MDD5440765.1 MgtC/SapB family protein [Candidatus Omnitrophota bacterium]